MMVSRKILLATIFAFLYQPYCQERVFVDINRLVSAHPAWQLATQIPIGKGKAAPVNPSMTLQMTRVQSLFQLPLTEEIRLGAERQLKVWDDEIETLKQRHLKIANWQLPLVLPVFPPVDLRARWDFIVQQKEKQIAERVRLNLRLAFADLLSPEERISLEQRLKELDAALEPKPILQPLPIPIEIPQQEIELTPLHPLTDPSKILAIVAQPLLTPQQTLTVELISPDVIGQEAVRSNPLQTLRSIALQSTRSFVMAYARKRNWQVTFNPEPSLPDGTDEVLREWLHWLKRLSPKE